MEAKTYHTDYGTVCYWVDKTAGPNKQWLVFLPGLTADHAIFEFQLQFFAGKYNCFVWDAPAHGKSRPYPLNFTLDDYATTVFKILEGEGAANIILIGQSLGGYISQAFMDLFHGVVSGFVSIDSSTLKRKYYPNWEVAFLRHTKGMYLSIPWSLLKSLGSKGNSVSAEGQAYMRSIMDSYTKREYCALAAHGYKMLADALDARRPYAIDCPALLLCGENDRAGDVKVFNKKWTEGEGIPLVWVPGAGHNSNMDNPTFVNRQIDEFITMKCSTLH